MPVWPQTGGAVRVLCVWFIPSRGRIAFRCGALKGTIRIGTIRPALPGSVARVGQTGERGNADWTVIGEGHTRGDETFWSAPLVSSADAEVPPGDEPEELGSDWPLAISPRHRHVADLLPIVFESTAEMAFSGTPHRAARRLTSGCPRAMKLVWYLSPPAPSVVEAVFIPQHAFAAPSVSTFSCDVGSRPSD